MKKLLLAALCLPALGFAADAEYQLTLKDHRFAPAEIQVPAGKKLKLVVLNQDSTPEEFESHSLNREKVIPGNSRGIIYVGPLAAGKYEFFGEFHEATARGALVAR